MSSIKSGYDIFIGCFHLLVKYPILIVPLIPVYLIVSGVCFWLDSGPDFFVGMFLIFVAAFSLMFSFVITSNMLMQIHNGQEPSLGEAISSPKTIGMFPKVIVLTIIWFSLVLILIFVEMLINSLLRRVFGRGNYGSRIVNFITGGIADALRMMGFMLIPIMLFEDVGLSKGFSRMKSVLKESPIKALTGLALTGLVFSATTLVAVAIYYIYDVAILSNVMILILYGMGWCLGMYLEQLFVAGLYLYSTQTQSEVVSVLLEKHIGLTLPEIQIPERPQ